MKSRVISISCFVVMMSPAFVFCQNSFISVGGEIGIPNSDGLDLIAGTLTGGSIRIESSFSKHVAGMATIDYLFSSEQTPYSNVPTFTATYKVIPLHLGIKYYIKKPATVRRGLFFSGELGFLFTRYLLKYASNPLNPEHKRKETHLAFAPGIGYLLGRFEPGFRLQYDLTDSGFNIYYFNFRVAYAFRKNIKS